MLTLRAKLCCKEDLSRINDLYVSYQRSKSGKKGSKMKTLLLEDKNEKNIDQATLAKSNSGNMYAKIVMGAKGKEITIDNEQDEPKLILLN